MANYFDFDIILYIFAFKNHVADWEMYLNETIPFTIDEFQMDACTNDDMAVRFQFPFRRGEVVIFFDKSAVTESLVLSTVSLHHSCSDDCAVIIKNTVRASSGVIRASMMSQHHCRILITLSESTVFDE